MTVGERLKSRRKTLQLTMKDITAMTGIKSGSLSEIENNKYLPSVQTLIPLSQSLKCSIDWILTGQQYATDSKISENYDEKNSSDLTQEENDLVQMYRALDRENQIDAFGNMKMKYDRIHEKGKLSRSTYTEETADELTPENGTKGTA